MTDKEIVKRLKEYLVELRSTRRTIGKFNIEADLVILDVTEIITPPKRDEYGDRAVTGILAKREGKE